MGQEPLYRPNTCARQAEESYPTADTATLELEYAAALDGKIWLHRWGYDNKNKRFSIPICTPFTVTARLRYADDQDSYGLRILMEDMAAGPREVDIERGTLARNNGVDVLEALYRNGMCINAPKGERIVLAILKAVDPAIEIVRNLRDPGSHDGTVTHEPRR
jgi:hypothetical protein